ncbi:MAG: hypothetical protein V5A68_07030 [Candidatus Thermoplasmatota archaeon]
MTENRGKVCGGKVMMGHSGYLNGSYLRYKDLPKEYRIAEKKRFNL